MIAGSTARGTPNAASSASSHSSVRRFISWVRLAFVASVTCRPARFHSSHVSMVPNTNSPASARARAPGTVSSSQRNFSALK